MFTAVLNQVAAGLLHQAGLGSTVRLAGRLAVNRDPSSLAGASWVAYNGLRGVLRPPRTPTADSLPDLRKGIRFADHPRVLNDLLFRRFGDEHVLYNLLGLLQTFRAMGKAMGSYAQEVGLDRYLESYLETLNNSDRLKVLPKHREAQRRLLEKTGLIYSEWVMRYAAANGWNVRFRGIDKIPSSGRVVYALAPHSAIYPDFFFTFADHLMMPVADLFNFRDNPSSRKFGMALIVDIMRLPLIDRQNMRNMMRCMKQIKNAAIEQGYRPGWFINGGRVPPAYKDDGTLDRAGYYSNVLSIEYPRTYIHAAGAVMNALDIAKETGEPVKLTVVTISGAECMRKIARNFPFIQANGIKGDIVYEVVESIDVTARDRSRRRELEEEVDRLARHSLAIDLYLREVVQQWGLRRGDVEAGRKFDQRAVEDVVYRILADRIRCIRPSNHARTRFIHRLLDAVMADNPPSPSELDAFLLEVSQAVLDAQREDFP